MMTIHETADAILRSPGDVGKAITALYGYAGVIGSIPVTENLDGIREAIMAYAGMHDRGFYLHTLRTALALRSPSMSPYEIVYVIGPAESVRRIRMAARILTLFQAGQASTMISGREGFEKWMQAGCPTGDGITYG